MRRLQDMMAQHGVGLCAIAPTTNMRYLLGFAPLADERPCFLLLSPRANALVVPALNADQVEAHTGLESIRWADESGPQQAIETALAQLGVGPGTVMAADNLMRADAFPELFEHPDVLQGLMQDWHPGVGRAIVEAWGFPEPIAVAHAVTCEVTERGHALFDNPSGKADAERL